VTIGAVALGVLILSTACTRRGGNGIPPVVTPTPISNYYVDPAKGSDKNAGTSAAPFKTLTHAMSVVKSSATGGLTISLGAGNYTAANGEKFPIAIPTGVILSGSGYGRGFRKGVFINGVGEDTYLESKLKAPPHSYYATIVVQQGTTLVTFDQMYVGSLAAINAGAYSSLDVLGSMTASQDSFGAAVRGPNAGGVVLPSGSMTCTGCSIGGPRYAIEAFTLPAASSAPNIILNGPGNSYIAGGEGLLTDGTATINAQNQFFASSDRAYTDSLKVLPTTSPLVRMASGTSSPSPSPTSSGYYGSGTVDFGYGQNGSLGGNSFLGSKIEIEVTSTAAAVSALNDTWNPAQGATKFGHFRLPKVFRPGDAGQNVTIFTTATGSLVLVGPAPAPTPSPTPYSSSSPSASPSASPTP
jgi:hypothetical protein